jgi:hypothetical protein
MKSAGDGLMAVLLAIIGVAILSVLVSKQSNTSGVLTAFGTAFGGILKVAVSPVGGGGLSTPSLPALPS